MKPIRVKSSIPEMDKEYLNMYDTVASKLSHHLVDKENQVVKVALKRKGYEFENYMDLENFIRANCRGAQKDNETTYYVKDVPFLLVVRPPFEPKIRINESGEISISAESFKYSFL